MPFSESERAVVDHLLAEEGRRARLGPPDQAPLGASHGRDPLSDVDPATVRFRKTRVFASCWLHYLVFNSRDGMGHDLVVKTWQGPGGSWSVGPIGGGAGGHPHRGKPWVNFAAQWSRDVFAAGGEVIGEDAERARLVRLRFADGAVLEDTVDGGVVLLFASPGVAFPAEVEVIDGDGTVLVSYDEFASLHSAA